MAGDETRILGKAAAAASKDRRIANQAQELKLMKWLIGIGFISIGAIGVGAIALYRIDTTAAEVQAMPNPAQHEKVHEIQDIDRNHIKETVNAIQAQQTIDAGKIDRTERTMWKIAQKLGVE